MRINHWSVKSIAPKKFSERFPEYNPITLQLLFNRGIKTQKNIDEFLGPDYNEDLHSSAALKNINRAVKRVFRAVKNKEKIVVYGDYDADGVCGSTILVKALREIGAENLDNYIPDRNKEGYGLNLESIQFLAQKKTDLIITIDCGVSDYDEVGFAGRLGIEVIIVDHHTIPKRLPRAYAIINPRQRGDKYLFKELAATGVAFKFAKALLIKKKLNDEREKWFLDLVAIATITDRMLLLGENRTLVKYGLMVLTKTKCLGLKELLKSIGKDRARVQKSERRKFDILGLDARDLGFMIGPRLNAAGRMDHANASFELLNTTNIDTAKRLVAKLNLQNQERQKLCGKIFNEIAKRIGEVPREKIIIEGSPDWPVGIVGLVAGKIAEKYHRPALIYHRGQIDSDGSARTIKSFNIVKTLRKAGDLLGEHGGHAMAAGFHIKNENIAAFKQLMIEIANKEIKDDELSPEIEIDIDLTNFQFPLQFGGQAIFNFQLNSESKILGKYKIQDWRELYEAVEDFRPFGPGNEEPAFLLRGCVVKNSRVVGKNGAGHLKARIDCGGQEFNCIGFGLGGWYGKIKIEDKIDIVFNLRLNEWNGNRDIELRIIDLKSSSRL